MAIDGAHIRAAHGYQSRHIDVTVGKIEVAGQTAATICAGAEGGDGSMQLEV